MLKVSKPHQQTDRIGDFEHILAFRNYIESQTINDEFHGIFQIAITFGFCKNILGV